MTTLSPKALALLRLAFGVLALGAVGVQLAIQIDRGYSVANFFSYFTNLSNLFAAGVLIAGAARLAPGGMAREPGDFVRGLSAVNMVVVGLVYAALLRHVNLGSLRPAINVVLHDVMPVVVLLDWLLAPPRRRLGAAFIPACLIVPVLYLGYTLLRGGAVDWYPYPFLNPEHHENGYAGVAAYAVGIGVTFVVVAAIVRMSGNWARSRLATLSSSPVFVNFAYGSNMCSRRLRERTPSARPLGVGRLAGHKLMWHMAGGDGSAKCDIVETGRPEDVVWGVLYEIAAAEKPLLDRAEGLGHSYHRKTVSVHHETGPLEAETYCALAIDATRQPYDWYHAYVLAGALEHGLPGDYAEVLKALEVVVDPDAERRRKNLALTAGR